MKKKFIVLLATMVMCLLAGCGAKEPDTDLVTEVLQEETAPKEDQEIKEIEEMTPSIESLFERKFIAAGPKEFTNDNPLMTQRYGADPYAMVYGDRVYFYMTADAYEYDANGEIKENSYSQIRSINVISTDDMINFTDHGSIQVAGKQGAATWANNSWAPAACWKNIDGKDKFFLYFANSGGGIGVLSADSPVGPFTDPIGKALISRDMENCGNVLWLFDPAVLVDDDGTGYIYFGGGVPEGKVSAPGTGRVAKLGADMISIDGDVVALDVPYLFEDSGIHKYNNKYYYTYCTNWQVDAEGTAKYGFKNGEIAMMESDSPMGPFVYKERILENPGGMFGLGGNNHHCVFQFKDQWYITYHSRLLEKKLRVEKGYRCTHVDEFTMGEDGTIGRIQMTYKGRKQVKNFDPYKENSAACFAVMNGLNTEKTEKPGEMKVTEISTGDYFLIKGVDFGKGTGKTLKIKARTNEAYVPGCGVQLRADIINGEAIATVAITESAEFTEFSADVVKCPEGVQNLYFVFVGEGFELLSWEITE